MPLVRPPDLTVMLLSLTCGPPSERSFIMREWYDEVYLWADGAKFWPGTEL